MLYDICINLYFFIMQTTETEPVTKEVEKITVVSTSTTKKSGSKKWLVIIIGALLALCFCVVVVVVAYLLINSTPSAKDYLLKTETQYNDVKAQFAKVNDSILNYYSVEATGDKYADMMTKVEAAYTTAADLETKVTAAKSAIPAAGSDVKTLDTALKDYYQASGELATSYKDLLNVQKLTMPVVKDFQDMGLLFSSLGEPTTAADFTSFSTKLKAQKAILVTDLSNIAAIKSTADTEFIKTSVSKLVTASIEFLDAFIIFADKSAAAIASNDMAALTAAGSGVTAASEKFQLATADTSGTDSKNTMVVAFKAKLAQITQKQTLTDAEFTKVKASAN